MRVLKVTNETGCRPLGTAPLPLRVIQRVGCCGEPYATFAFEAALGQAGRIAPSTSACGDRVIRFVSEDALSVVVVALCIWGDGRDKLSKKGHHIGIRAPSVASDPVRRRLADTIVSVNEG